MQKRNYNVLGGIVLALLLYACGGSKFIPHENVSYNYPVVESAEPNALDSFLIPYKKGSDSIMQLQIGTTTVPLSKSQPESTMGNFVVDAQLLFAQKKDKSVVASIMNYGGIRLPYLAPGPLTVGNMFEIMPFDNSLVIAEVPGTVVKELCSLMVAKKGWPQAGFTIVAHADNTVKSILINGAPVNDFLIYKIAISDYLAGGGDGCEFFKTCKRKYYNVFIRDIMIAYLQEQGTISPQLTHRIVYE